MAQTLTFNDADVEVQIDTSTGTNDLRITGEEGQRVVTAIRELKKQLPDLRKVIWDIPGGGIVGRLGVWADDTPRIIYLNFSDLTQPSPNFYYEFFNGAWTDEEIGYLDKLKDAFLDFNTGHTLTSAVAGSVDPETIWATLHSYYPLDETGISYYNSLGPASLEDDALLSYFTSVSGKSGNAIQEGANCRYVTTGLAFPFTGDFSISVWAKFSTLDVTPDTQWMLGKYDGASIAIMARTDDAISLRLGAATLPSSPGTLTAGVFHHFVWTYDGTTKDHRMYFNGSQINLNGSPTNNYNVTDGSEIFIGHASGGDKDDTYDELAIFNSKLSDADILLLYNSGIGRFF